MYDSQNREVFGGFIDSALSGSDPASFEEFITDNSMKNTMGLDFGYAAPRKVTPFSNVPPRGMPKKLEKTKRPTWQNRP